MSEPNILDLLPAFAPVERELPDGRAVCLFPLTFGRARIGITAAGDRSGFVDIW